MRKYLLLFLVIQLIGINQLLQAQTINSTQTGDWQDNATWGNVTYPDGNCGCTQIILNHNITIRGQGSDASKIIDLTNSTNLTEVIIRANQTLTFENNTQLILPAGATIILEEGATIEGPTNRSGSLISIGGNEIWGNSCADCTEGPLTGPGTMDQNSDPASPLPIELLYFKGRATAEGYALEWATVSEENFDYFTLERSTNAADFYPVGTIKGHGNSTSTLVYKYLDKEAPEGISYYRLKATDFDGYTEYFKIISLHKELREKLAEVYPNPVDEGILRVLTHPKVQEAVLQLQDMSGHTVYSEVLANSSEEIILNNNIRPGTYLLSIKGQNINHIQLLIVN